MEKGDLVSGEGGQQYRIEGYLGEGVTSRVYQATDLKDNRLVALKMLRPGVSPLISDNFWEEGHILGRLAAAEYGAGDGLVSIPRQFASHREGSHPYLALEWISGEPVTRRLEREEALPEPLALTVADQVLRVLHLLHTNLRRTYTDFQLQNIWLQEAEGNVVVKVMDWNHVSKEEPGSTPLPPGFGAGDLARFGAYFYRMVTGKGANERGEAARYLARRAGSQWEALSLGTRQIVVRALHPDPARRFASAQAFRDAVQAQAGRLSDEGVLFAELGHVRKRLALLPSPGQTGGPALDEAEAETFDAILDMAERRGYAAQVERYRQQLRQETGEVSVVWQAGLQYYHAEQYHEAAEKWRTEAERLGEVHFWRWFWLAEAGTTLGKQRFAPFRERFEAALHALDAYEPQRATDILTELYKNEARCKAQEAFDQEALTLTLVEEAQAKEGSELADDLEAAADKYREAYEGLAFIPYAALLCEEQEWPDLKERADALKDAAKTRRAEEQESEQLRQLLDEDPEEGLTQIEESLRLQPEQRGLVRLCWERGKALREKGQIAAALALLEKGLLLGQVSEYHGRLREEWLWAMEAKPEVEATNRMRAEYEQERERLLKQHQEEQERLRQEHEEEEQALRESHEKTLAELSEQQAFHRTEQAQRFDAELRNGITQHQTTLATLTEWYDKALTRTLAYFATELAAAAQACEDQRQAYEAEERKLDTLLATLKESHESKYEERKAELEQEHEERKAALEQEYGARFDVERAELLLSEGKWEELLPLVPPDHPILTQLGENGWVTKLEATLEDILQVRNVAQAEALLLVLARLDDEPNAVAARQYKVEAARRQLTNDQYNWQRWVWDHTQALHREQRVSKSVLLAWVAEFLLPLTERIEAWRQVRPNLETLRGDLETEVEQQKAERAAEEMQRVAAAKQEAAKALVRVGPSKAPVAVAPQAAPATPKEGGEQGAAEDGAEVAAQDGAGAEKAVEAPPVVGSEVSERDDQSPPAPSSSVPARREEEALVDYADRVMGAGADAFKEFTFLSLGRAKTCFQEAYRLDPELKLAHPLLAWVERLIEASPPHASERWAFVQRQEPYRDLRESVQANRSTWPVDEFLQTNSVLEWMNVARQENGHAQSKLRSDSASAARHKERAYYLGQLVHRVLVWEGEQVFKGVERPLQAEEIRTFGAGVEQFVKETKAIGLVKQR